MTQEPAPPRPAPQTPKPAPGLLESFELALTAIADPSVFVRASERPAPALGAAIGLALASGAAALAVNLAHAAVSSPDILREFPPQTLAAVAAAALGLDLGLLFLLSAALQAIAGACGGKGEFARGLQAAAMISVLAPAQMLCNWFSAAWIAPSLLAAWLAAGALEGLFKARRGPARALCGALAAGAIGLQFAGRALADRARDAYAAAQEVSAAAELARSMPLALPLPGAPAGGAAAPASAVPAVSGLDLLRGAAGQDAARDGAAGETVSAQGAAAPAPAALAAARPANVAGMLDALTPMLDALANSRTATPQQKADVKELQDMLRDLKAQTAPGASTSSAEFAKKMARYQALLLRTMSNAAQAGSAAPDAPR